MEFDESEIINPLHTDKAEIGKMYYYADDLISLKEFVTLDNTNHCARLSYIMPHKNPFRFSGGSAQFLYPGMEIFDNNKVITPNSDSWSNYTGCNVIFADTYHELRDRFANMTSHNAEIRRSYAVSYTGVFKGWSETSLSFIIEGKPNKVFDFLYVLV